MRLFLLTLFLLTGQLVTASYMAPYLPLSLAGRPYPGDGVVIKSEHLTIRGDAHFQVFQFEAIYAIEVTDSTCKVPLLFYLGEGVMNFHATVNGKEAEVREMPFVDGELDRSLFPGQPDMLEFSKPAIVPFKYSPHFVEAPSWVPLYNFNWMDVPLESGVHQVHLSFELESMEFTHKWVNHPHLVYSLVPSGYNPIFAPLTLTLDNTLLGKKIISNLGPPKSGRTDSIATWSRDTLSPRVVQFAFQPEISPVAKKMAEIGPHRPAHLWGISLALIHLWLVYRSRRRRARKNVGNILLGGMILVPFLYLLVWVLFHYLIDFMIGPYAHGDHDFLGIFLMTIPVTIGYMLLAGSVNIVFKKIVEQTRTG